MTNALQLLTGSPAKYCGAYDEKPQPIARYQSTTRDIFGACDHPQRLKTALGRTGLKKGLETPIAPQKLATPNDTLKPAIFSLCYNDEFQYFLNSYGALDNYKLSAALDVLYQGFFRGLYDVNEANPVVQFLTAANFSGWSKERTIDSLLQGRDVGEFDISTESTGWGSGATLFLSGLLSGALGGVLGMWKKRSGPPEYSFPI